MTYDEIAYDSIEKKIQLKIIEQSFGKRIRQKLKVIALQL